MIVAISGEKGAGKDTLALILAQALHVRMYALAAPVKKAVSILFKSNDHIEYYTNDFYDKNERTYIVTVDMEKVRDYLLEVHGESAALEEVDTFFKECFKDFVLSFSGYVVTLRLTLRDMFQRFGTDFCQGMLGELCWCELIPASKNLIITDVRFPHEREYIKEKLPSVYFIYVDNPYATPNLDSHPSEQDMRDFVYNSYIYNTKVSKQYLREQVGDVILELKRRVNI